MSDSVIHSHQIIRNWTGRLLSHRKWDSTVNLWNLLHFRTVNATVSNVHRSWIIAHCDQSSKLARSASAIFNLLAERTIKKLFCQVCSMPSGRMLGGSSSLNCMVFVRGAAEDFDNWEAMGAKGWLYKDVLPYFIKAEHVHDLKLRFSGELFHIVRGPLSFSRFFVRKKSVKKLRRSCLQHRKCLSLKKSNLRINSWRQC